MRRYHECNNQCCNDQYIEFVRGRRVIPRDRERRRAVVTQDHSDSPSGKCFTAWLCVIRTCMNWCWSPCVESCPERKYVTLIQPVTSVNKHMDHLSSIECNPIDQHSYPDDALVRVFEHITMARFSLVKEKIREYPALARASMSGCTLIDTLMSSGTAENIDQIKDTLSYLSQYDARMSNTPQARNILIHHWPSIEYIQLCMDHGVDPSYETKREKNIIQRVLEEYGVNAVDSHTRVRCMEILFRHASTPEIWSSHDNYINTTLHRFLTRNKGCIHISNAKRLSQLHYSRCVRLQTECRYRINEIFLSAPDSLPGVMGTMSLDDQDNGAKKTYDLAASMGNIVLQYLGM